MNSFWRSTAERMNSLTTLTGQVAAANQQHRTVRMLTPSNGLILAYSMVLILMLLGSLGKELVECNEQQLEVVSREQKDTGDSSLSATIDYLEKLDKYYSQIARPRFGRSGSGTGLTFNQFLNAHSLSSKPEHHQAHTELRLLEILANQLARKNKELSY